MIESWCRSGARVVTFDSGAGLFRGQFPLDTVVNVVGLWAWIGEFVAACTRHGKMPVLYQSYGLPGGIERGKRYEDKRFHDDLAIKPIGEGALGRQYLSKIEQMLNALEEGEMKKIQQAGEWWRQVSSESSLTLVTGHMFPRHAQDPRAPALSKFAAAATWEKPELGKERPLPPFVLYLGYQLAPDELIRQAKVSGTKLAYSSVRAAKSAEPSRNILYLDPKWPLTDGCVEVPGYDVPILPASGVMQAALLWTLAAERGEE